MSNLTCWRLVEVSPFSKKNLSHFSDLKKWRWKNRPKELWEYNFHGFWVKKTGLSSIPILLVIFWSIFASWWFQIFFIFTLWLIFFKGVGSTTNQFVVTTNFGPPDCPFKRCKCTTSPTQTDQKISTKPRPWWWWCCCVAKAVVCFMWVFPKNRGVSPQIIHFNRVFHYKPFILGYPYFWKPLCIQSEDWTSKTQFWRREILEFWNCNIRGIQM